MGYILEISGEIVATCKLINMFNAWELLSVLGGAGTLIGSSPSILKVHASGKPLGPEFLIFEKSSHILLFPRFLYLVWVLRC